MPVITFFGSGKALQNSIYYERVLYASGKLSEHGFDIATGGYRGIMEAALKGACNTGARRIGIVSELYKGRTVNEFVVEKINCGGYLDRLDKLIEIGDAYALFPGGSGTLLEFTYIWAMKDRGLLNDKLAVCYGREWRRLISCLQSSSGLPVDAIEIYEDLDRALNRIFHFFNAV